MIKALSRNPASVGTDSGTEMGLIAYVHMGQGMGSGEDLGASNGEFACSQLYRNQAAANMKTHGKKEKAKELNLTIYVSINNALFSSLSRT